MARVLLGLLSVAAGAVALIWPGITALVLVLLIGSWALIGGVLVIWAAARSGGRWPMLVLGVASMLAGVLILLRPDGSAAAIALVIGVYAIVAGILMLTAVWREYRSMQAPAHRTA